MFTNLRKLYFVRINIIRTMDPNYITSEEHLPGNQDGKVTIQEH